MRRAIAARAERFGGGELTSVSNKARRLMEGLGLDPAERYERYMSWFDGDQRARLYTDEFAEAVSRVPGHRMMVGPWLDASGEDVLDKMLEVDVMTYLPGDLITKIDIATMAYALEARSPLLDHELMEFAASIPANLKVRGREKKWIFRQALRGWIPDEILDRPKQGFSVPLGEWFRGDLRTVLHDVLLDPATVDRGYFRPEMVRSMLDRHDAGDDAETKPLWSLFVFELWQRELVDPTPRSAALEATV